MEVWRLDFWGVKETQEGLEARYWEDWGGDHCFLEAGKLWEEDEQEYL